MLNTQKTIPVRVQRMATDVKRRRKRKGMVNTCAGRAIISVIALTLVWVMLHSIPTYLGIEWEQLQKFVRILLLVGCSVAAIWWCIHQKSFRSLIICSSD